MVTSVLSSNKDILPMVLFIGKKHHRQFYFILFSNKLKKEFMYVEI